MSGQTIVRQPLKRSWLEQRRDCFLRSIISEFLQLSDLYTAIYRDYRTHCSAMENEQDYLLAPVSVPFRQQLFKQLSVILGSESAKGLLWRLKDTCHQVWPEDRREESVNGSIVDWLIGSLFHEAMKLKENIYLLNNYSPSSPRLELHSQPGGVSHMKDSPHALLRAIDTQGVFRRIALDVEEQLEGIGILLGRANYLLRMMMPELAGNALVVRLLAEKEEMIEDLWGETLTSVFSDMFYGNAADGFCMAGRSYLSGQWYKSAMAMYRKAVDIDPACTEAVTKLIQLKAITREHGDGFGNETI